MPRQEERNGPAASRGHGRPHGDVTGLAADPASEVSRYGVKLPVGVCSSTTQSMIAGRRVDHAGGDVSFYLRRKKPSQMVSHGQKE